MLWLRNLKDVSKTVYESAQAHKQWAFIKKRRQLNLASRTRLFYFLYLTGARIGETMLTPLPTIKLSNMGTKNIIIVSHQNEKHFNRNGDRTMITEVLFINGLHEKLMWEYVMPGEMIPDKDYSIDYFMAPLLQHHTYLSPKDSGFHNIRTNLSRSMSYFKANMTDGETMYPAHGYAPHQLRHLRVYALHFNWGYSWDLIQAWLGWAKADMREHYVYIAKQLKQEEQMLQLKQHVSNPSNLNLDLTDYGLSSLA